jgi:hypothetical protein
MNNWIDINVQRPGLKSLVWVWVETESWVTLAIHEDLYAHKSNVETKYVFRHWRNLSTIEGVTQWMRLERPDSPVPLDTVTDTLI